MKKIVLCKRKRELSVEQFRNHWRTVHGPLLMSIPSYKDYSIGYVQNHMIGSGPVGGAFQFDGVSDILQADTSGRTAFSQTAVFREKVIPDEMQMLDRHATLVCTADEFDIIPGTGPVKVVMLWRRKLGLDHQEALEAWRTGHLGTLMRQPGFQDHVRGYRQNCMRRDSFVRLTGEPLEDLQPFDGMSEFWFDDVDAAVRTLAVTATSQASFVESSRTQSFLSEEIRFF